MRSWLAAEYRLSGSALSVRPPMAWSSTSAKRTPSVDSQSGACSQASSVKAKNLPRAFAAPALRAAAGPACDRCSSVLVELTSEVGKLGVEEGLASVVHHDDL